MPPDILISVEVKGCDRAGVPQNLPPLSSGLGMPFPVWRASRGCPQQGHIENGQKSGTSPLQYGHLMGRPSTARGIKRFPDYLAIVALTSQSMCAGVPHEDSRSHNADCDDASGQPPIY